MSLAEAVNHRPNPTKAAPTRGTLQRLRGIVGTLIAVIVVIVAAIVVVIAVATRLSSKQQYTAFGHPIMVVLSGSMAPVINTGDLIIDNPLNATQAARLHVGQIITFHDSPGSSLIFTHRIVKVVHQAGQTLYQTKGDANNAPDATLRKSSQLVGTYAEKIPRGGYFLTNLHKPIVLALLLLAPILWFVAEPLRRWAREEETEPLKDPSDTDGAPEDQSA